MMNKRNFLFLLIPIFMLVSLSGCTTEEILENLPKIPEAEQTKTSALDSYKYGDLLYCKIGEGTVNFGKQWRDFKDRNFVVIKDSRSNIHISAKNADEHATIQAMFDTLGQKLTFCPLPDANSNGQVDCQNIYFIDNDLDMGIKRSIDIKNFIQGGVISCAYARDNMKNLQPPR